MPRTAAEIGPEDMARYRETRRLREEKRALSLVARLGRARSLADEAARLLRQRYGASRVVAYGSLARGGFSELSDVDLCAWGIASEYWCKAPGDVYDLDREIDLNLVLAQDASQALMAEIEKDGRDLPWDRTTTVS